LTLQSPFHYMIPATMIITQSQCFFSCTEFHSFVHTPSRKCAIHTLQYSIPRDLVSHIKCSVVHPMTLSDLAKPLSISVSYAHQKFQARMHSCSITITSQCLQELYVPMTLATQSSSQIAIPGLMHCQCPCLHLKSHPVFPFFVCRSAERLRPDMPSNTTFSVR
ncbi:hypothetical protein F5050DRAFT_1582282, partial [Lentinula boryana]